MLRDKWKDRQNDVDAIDAGDINSVAHAVIDIEDRLDEEIFSPTVEILPIEGGNKVIITDAEGKNEFVVHDGVKGETGPAGPQGKQGPQGETGQQGEDGQDGFSPTVEVVPITGGHIVMITDVNGTKTFTVMDGKTASEGGGGSGEDGFSPIIIVTKIEGGHRVAITDVNGTQTFDVLD